MWQYDHALIDDFDFIYIVMWIEDVDNSSRR